MTVTKPRRRRRTFEEKIAEHESKLLAMKRDAIGRRLVELVALARAIEELAQGLGLDEVMSAAESMAARGREFLARLEAEDEDGEPSDG